MQPDEEFQKLMDSFKEIQCLSCGRFLEKNEEGIHFGPGDELNVCQECDSHAKEN